ncbi:MAG: UDP-N-acetylmuramate--L-alanine ligase [Deltaproteobacteria bacterium]|nr:UDP-N-acetylmuramate--L-alanine ligase [Deltaproteobacteria bacterium]
MRRRTGLVHFVGVGGIGMSGIAEVCLNLGFKVRGSDLKASEVTRRLSELGVDLREGHDARNVEGADVVVISSAVRSDNPELLGARAAKIPVIKRAEMLAELMRMKYAIAIAGTHGKTTTTSLVATVLSEAHLDPTVVVGGKLNQTGTNAKLGQSDYLVAEADESDGSFLSLFPTIALVSNVDPEHLDHYQHGMSDIVDAFLGFVSRVPFYGLAVLCIDHPVVRELSARIERRVVTYGLSSGANVRATDIVFDGPRTSFEVFVRGASVGRFDLPMLGEHNVRNALGAIAIADELGVDVDVTRRALSSFMGVDRRFSVRGRVDRVRGLAADVMVVDDYGHHPEEIRATLLGAGTGYPGRRILVGFQPHRYTRTRDLMDGFVTAFPGASRVVLAPIYSAGEDPIEGVSSEVLRARLEARGVSVDLVGSVDALAETLAQNASGDDLVVIFGAGDVARASKLVLASLIGPRAVSA